MRIETSQIKIGSRVKLLKGVEMFNCTYTKGHEFTICGHSYRGWDLIDDDGNRIYEFQNKQNKLELIDLEKRNKEGKIFKNLFMTYFDGCYGIDPKPNTCDTLQMGICKLDYKENELVVYLRQPGLLIGKGGQTIDALINYLGCKISIVEVDLVNEIQNPIEHYKGKK